MTALIFEDYVLTWGKNGWYFEFQGKIHGPWHTKIEAEHALDALMSDFYQDDSGNAA